jgi:opacity protein-like surface antigen
MESKTINNILKNNRLIFLLFLAFNKSFGQDIPVFKLKSPFSTTNYFQLHLNSGPSIPLNGTSSYISKIDIRPINVSFDYVFKKNAIGLQFSNQYFAQKIDRDDYQYGSTNFSTAMSRTLRINPILLTVSHFFNKHDKKIRPYSKLGVGLMHINYLAYWGYSPDPKKTWQPTFNAIAGIKKEIGKTEHWFLDLNIGYQFADFDYDFISKVSVANVGIGIGYRWQNSNKKANLPFNN